MSNVSEIAKKLNKAWKQEILTSGNILPECQRVSLGSLGADYALYGGIPLGCLTVFAGLQHSGKTTAACQAMAQYQRMFPDRTCIYVDAENTLITQKEFLVKMTGLIIDDPSKFLRMDCTGRSAEEIFQDIIELQQADNIGMIIIDSAPTLISQADLDNEFTKDAGMRASVAKSLGKFIKQMIMYLPKRNNSLIIINQVREDGKTFTGVPIYKEPCGYALNYFPSMKVRFGTRGFVAGDKVDLGINKGEEADGFRLKFQVTKSRLGDLRRGGGFITYRYDSGIDDINDMLEVAMKFNFINRPNNLIYELVDLDTGELYCIDEKPLRFKGRQSLLDFLNENIEFRANYVEMLRRNIGAVQYKSLLDETTMNEILNQENSVENNAPHSDDFGEESSSKDE